MLVVVRPPQIWVELGVIPAGTLWTLKRAVFGLRIAPRAWGLFRDSELRSLRWTVTGEEYKLLQCISDTQVWQIVKVGEEDRILGLNYTYVDDFLLMAEEGEVTRGLIAAMKEKWNMSTEVKLTKDQPVTFVCWP